MGFCLLNNVAIAAAEARSRGYERVLVLDWDVHHGNGTEAMFYDDPSVLFVSLHQFPNYPGTGAISDVGRGDGRGSTVNLPLPKGGTDSLYAAAFERLVLPIVEQFAPSFALVSCGFDAHARDPLAEMELSADGFGAMTRSLLGRLPEACPLAVVLEGGYDLEALTASSDAVARALFGASPEPSPTVTAPGTDAQVLAEIARTQKTFWKLD
jgi:acetoin utilization deacetylase AcuC-like enzyme